MLKFLVISEIKNFLRLYTSEVDTTLELLAAQIESWLEESFGMPLAVTEYTHSFNGGAIMIKTRRQPLVAVSKVLDLFTNEEIALTDMRVEEGRIWRAALGSYPMLWDSGTRRFQVTYTAGYNDGSSVKPVGSVSAPSGLKLGLHHLVRRAYEARGNRFVSSSGVIMNWDELVKGEVFQLLSPFNPEAL